MLYMFSLSDGIQFDGVSETLFAGDVCKNYRHEWVISGSACRRDKRVWKYIPIPNSQGVGWGGAGRG